MPATAGKPRTDDDVIRAVQKCGGLVQKAAPLLGISVRGLHLRCASIEQRLGKPIRRHLMQQEQEFTVERPVDDLDIDELVARRKSQYNRRAAAEDSRALIRVNVKIGGPYGLFFFGDPHIDDDGTDITILEQHSRLILRTPGMFAVNVGDTTNNWVGRLARLYSQQSTTAKEAWALAEWWIKLLRPKWLALIGGNHDGWSGDGDPLLWITRQADAVYEKSQVRLEMVPPKGAPIIVNAAHDFRGWSQWNPAHGGMKAARFGFRDDLFVNGHKHVSGYGQMRVADKICHVVQVASYKIHDHYARELGLLNQSISPCAVAVVNPQAAPAGRITVFHDPDLAADFLNFLRAAKK